MLDLSSHPRVPLAHLPTPLELLPRLTEHLGGKVEVWIKRDDCTGLALGGNKTRKLEFLAGKALAEKCDCLVTCGAVQSNHVRQTAAVAAKLGLGCHIALLDRVEPGEELYSRGGNRLLDELLGATLHFTGVETTSKTLNTSAEEAVAAAANAARNEGKTPYIVPYGGSDAVGALGYVAAAQELMEQSTNPIAAVVHASGSGGTQGGLAVGMMDTDVAVLGIDIEGKPDSVRAETQRVVDGTCDYLGVASMVRDIHVVEGYAGPGYGKVDESTLETIRLLARLEGIILDPVYTGKAMAGLVGEVKKGRFAEGARVVFIHTGGAPAVFAYRELLPS